MSGHGNQVFHDPKGARARLVGVLGKLILVLLACAVVLVGYGMIVAPSLPTLIGLEKPDARQDSVGAAAGGRWLSDGISPAPPPLQEVEATPRLAFVNLFDHTSLAAFRQQAQRLDGVIIDGFQVKSRPAPSTPSAAEPFRLSLLQDAKEFLKLADRVDASLLRVATLSADNAMARWEALGSSPDLGAHAAWIAEQSVKHRISGVLVDARDLPQENWLDVARILSALRDALAQRGLMVLVHVSPTSDETILNLAGDLADYTVFDLFRPDYLGAAPGPLAAHGAVQEWMATMTRAISPDRLIPVIGSFAESWRADGFRERHSVQEAWEDLRGREAQARFDARSLNLTFGARDPGGDGREVWVLDAASTFNSARVAMAYKPGALAVWRLGYEDPSLWKILGSGRIPKDDATAWIDRIDAGYDALTRRKGALIAVGPGDVGRREVVFSESAGLIVDQTIERAPLQFTLRTWAPQSPDMIALTFDDGPDPVFTPQILDILDRYDAKGTFYLLGKAAAEYPGLVREIVDRGHDIASHSHSHADMREMPQAQIALELNRAQRVFESSAGMRTKLFRPPYAAPDYQQFLEFPHFTETVGSLGYVIGGIDVESEDWTPFLKAEVIAHNVLSHLAAGADPVVLMHDGGADRTATVKALPIILETLSAEGRRFVTTHELYGLSREELTPALGADGLFAEVTAQLRGGIFSFEGSIEKSLPLAALGMTAVGGVRLLLIGLGAWLQTRRHRRRRAARAASETPPFRPRLCVLVPGYNEENVITMTVGSLLQSTYQGEFEIMVIDDGSTDRTRAVLDAAFADNPKVRIFTKANGGKARALNFGLEQTDADIVICIDADTVLEPDAIELLAARFEDPGVGAVAGNVVVGNRVNWIARLQAIEYVTAQNLDRRAFEMVNSIGVVPGAIGAWRRLPLLKAGGYPPDTLAEDADATVAMLRDGWRIECAPEALAHTEAPQTLLQFMKQRHRWCFGTLQVAFKNLLALPRQFRWNIALIYVPNVFIFQFAFALLAPMVDGLLVYGLVVSVLSMAQGGGGAVLGADLFLLAAFWALFQIIDFAVAAVGMALDRKTRDWSLLLWVPLQRVGFRQILYFVTLRALLSAMKGQFVGWGKLLRNASVVAPKTGGAGAR